MELKPVGATVKTPAAAFTGDVYLTPIHTGTGPSRMTIALVRFTPGAHTNWHSHAVGQTLHVTEGVGLVGTRDGDVVRIHAGETVVCPPEEEHWHGAAATTFMSHLAMLEAKPDGSDPTTWLEPVTDEDYERANTSISPARPTPPPAAPEAAAGFRKGRVGAGGSMPVRRQA